MRDAVAKGHRDSFIDFYLSVANLFIVTYLLLTTICIKTVIFQYSYNITTTFTNLFKYFVVACSNNGTYSMDIMAVVKSKYRDRLPINKDLTGL